MIALLVPLTFTGAIWYQGEGNAGRAYQYRHLLPVMIADWRGRFTQVISTSHHFPRLLPAAQKKSQESPWAVVREAQALTAHRLPTCDLALGIDLGEVDDIHPKNKQDVGRRLAL